MDKGLKLGIGLGGAGFFLVVTLVILNAVLGYFLAGVACVPAAPPKPTAAPAAPTPAEAAKPAPTPSAFEQTVREHKFDGVRCYSSWTGDLACVVVK